MESLPVEILHDIFAYFCLHCQHPEAFPQSDEIEDRQDKKTLASLCRTSKAINSVASPVLYHYFATGTQDWGVCDEVQSDAHGRFVEKIPAKKLEDQRRPSDLLPFFVRTILERPDLAVSVFSLQFVWQYIDAVYSDLDAFVDDFPILGLELEDGARAWDEYVDRHILCEWLWALVIQRCPNLHELFLCIGAQRRVLPDDVCFDLHLPSLRTLAVRSCKARIDVNQFELFSLTAPNLEEFYAVGPHGWCRDSLPLLIEEGDEGLLHRMRSMHVTGMESPDHLYDLLTVAPNLEYLEFYWFPNASFTLTSVLLEPVKKTLKKLHYACLIQTRRSKTVAYEPGDLIPFLQPDFDSFRLRHWQQPDADEEDAGIDARPTLAGNLRGFEVLEDLALDCRAIYRADDEDHPDRLVSLLPASLKFLRISYAYKSMAKAVMQLAAVAPDQFPHLERVEIGMASSGVRSLHDEIEVWGTEPAVYKDCIPVYETAEIELVFSRDESDVDYKAVLPGDTMGQYSVPLPRPFRPGPEEVEGELVDDLDMRDYSAF